MPDPARAAAAPEAPAPAVRLDWLEEERVLARARSVTVGRIVRRAAATWPLWVLLAVLAAGFVARSRGRKEFLYEGTVVLHVKEGNVANENNLLSLGEIGEQINGRALSSVNLVPVLRKHKIKLVREDIDAAENIEAFRKNLEVEIVESAFMEDDQTSKSARRSARVTIQVRLADNEKALLVARDLADLVVDSGVARQRKVLEEDAAATHEEATRAAAELAQMRRDGEAAWDKLQFAAQRFAAAQKAETLAAIALRALSGRQALGFEIVDPGRVEPLINRRHIVIKAFIFTLFGALVAFSLLVGVYDPRVLDAEDLTLMHAEVLARLPRLPPLRRAEQTARRGEAPEESERAGPRV